MSVLVTHWFDYKSPYAYVAQRGTFALEELGATLKLVPYTLDIASYLGRAELGPDGELVVDERTGHQWRRVRYSYMDCQREARRQGLVLRGTRKMFDSSTAQIGYLFAAANGDARPYHHAVFERFWRRELDIEDTGVVAAVLAECGIDAAGFPAYLAGPGRAELERLQREAEEAGVFGVPSYLVEGELYWGTERLERVREHLAG